MLIKNIENKMNHLVNKLNKKTSLTAKLFLAAALMAVTSVSVAEDDNVAYVDSVFKWGAWELDIEPAAGGISPPTPRALNARGAKITLRTNSIAALAPSAPVPGGGTPSNPIVPGTPVPPPVIPIPPTGPTIIPISPNIPIPVGGPGGGYAPAPTITTISPNVPIPVGGPGSIPSGGPGAS